MRPRSSDSTPRLASDHGPARTRRPVLRLLGAAVLLTLVGPAGASLATPLTIDLGTARDRLGELHAAFEIRVESYDAARVRLESARAGVARKQLLIARLSARIGERRVKAVGLAEELYKGGLTGPLEAVLSAGSLTSAGANLEYLKSSQAVQRRVFTGLEADRAALGGRAKALARARDRALVAEARLAGLEAAVKRRLATQRDAVTTLERRVAAQKRRQRERLAVQRALAAAEQRVLERAAARALERAERAPGPGVSKNLDLPAGSTLAAGPEALIAVRSALEQVGNPYVWAAAGPDAFDCSGLTSYAWGRAGLSLPHSSEMQYTATRRVAASEWQPGDLLFYGSPIHHVTMYIGGGRMVEAPYTGASVRVVPARTSDYVGAGRPGV